MSLRFIFLLFFFVFVFVDEEFLIYSSLLNKQAKKFPLGYLFESVTVRLCIFSSVLTALLRYFGENNLKDLFIDL